MEYPVTETFDRFVCLNIDNKHVDFGKSEVILCPEYENNDPVSMGTSGGTKSTNPFS